MLTLFIQQYLPLLLSISIISLLLFSIGFYFILRMTLHSSHKQELNHEVNQEINEAMNQKSTEKININVIEIPFPPKISPKKTITSDDIRAIAGNDVLATQLDLARAYIEADKKPLAKKILGHVLQKGNQIQQQEAKTLLNLI